MSAAGGRDGAPRPDSPDQSPGRGPGATRPDASGPDGSGPGRNPPPDPSRRPAAFRPDERPPSRRPAAAPPMWRRYLRFWGADPRADVEDELSFHVEERVDQLVARGMDPAAARREALRRLGDLERLKRDLSEKGERVERRRRRADALAGLGRDVVHAARRLRGEPAYAATALATLTLGIGAAVAMFTVVNAVVLRPLPYPAPERLVQLNPGLNSNITISRTLGAIPAVEAATGLSGWTVTLTGDGEAAAVSAQNVGHDFFRVFGVQPALGRPFRPSDAEPGLSDVVILSHGLWADRYGADPGIIGRRIELDGYGHATREVVGVMPAGFAVPDASGVGAGGAVQLWLPLALASERTLETDSTWYVNAVVARLAPGATVEQAAQQARAAIRSLRQDHPGRLSPAMEQGAGAMGLLDATVGDVRGKLWTLLAAVGLVLLLACANLANLMLARSERRRRDLAVRAALGAGRGRLVREQLVESALLALGGGVLGLALSQLVLRLLRIGEASGLPRATSLQPGLPVILFALGVAAFATLAFGLLPALRASRSDVRAALGSGTRTAGQTRAGGRLGAALVATEVALALILVVGAGLLLSSLAALRSVDPGMDPSDVLAVAVSPPDVAYRGERAVQLTGTLLERLAALPGVAGAGGIHLLPFSAGNWAFPYLADGHAPPSDGPLPSANFRAITPGYLEAVDQPLLAGRAIDATDREGNESVMLVNRAFADEVWPGSDPVGRTLLLFGSDPYRVVGVVDDVHQHALDLEPQPEMYVAQTQFGVASMVFMLEAEAGEPGALAGAARAAIREVAPDVPITSIRPLDDVLDASMAQRRFFAGVLAFFGLLALVLGAVGVYGVMSYGMGARRPEYGVRMALGATRGEVLGGAVRSGLVPVAVGLALGLAGALAASRLLTALLYGVRPGDPLTLAAAAAVLAAVGTAAVALPAWRVTRIDPAKVLRAE